MRLKPLGDLDDPRDYTEPDTIRDIVRRHSDFVSWPIRLRMAAADGEPLPAPDAEEAEAAQRPGGDETDRQEAETGRASTRSTPPERKPPSDAAGKVGHAAGHAADGEILNSRTPLWRRDGRRSTRTSTPT